MKELQFYFPAPGNWGLFILTAIFSDRNGFIQSRRFTQDDISTKWLEAFGEVVSVIAVLSDEWKAVQAWARLGQIMVPGADGEEGSMETVETIVLTVEAVNARGGRRVFTSEDYAEFSTPAKAAMEFFNHFTKNNNNHE